MKKVIDYAASKCAMSELVSKGVGEEYLRANPGFVEQRIAAIEGYLMGPGVDYFETAFGDVVIRLKGHDEAGHLHAVLNKYM